MPSVGMPLACVAIVRYAAVARGVPASMHGRAAFVTPQDAARRFLEGMSVCRRA